MSRVVDARRLSLAIGWVLLVALAITGTWLTVFSNFQYYDDEGYVLMSARKIVDGGRPYEDVYFQYGPVFALWKKLVHGRLGIPLSHDGVRMETTALLAAAFVLVAWIAHRLTRSHAAAMVALLVFLSSALFMARGEPGHPQFLCLLLTLLAFALLAALPGRSRVGWSAAAGAVVALLALAKVNSGAYVLMAVLTWLALPWAVARLHRVLLLGGAAIALQWGLMHGAARLWHGGSAGVWGGWTYWLVWSLGLASVMLACVRAPHGPRRLSLAGFAVGGAIVTALVVAWIAASGVPLRTLVDGVLLRPLGSISRWFIPVAVPPDVVSLHPFGAMLAAAYAASGRRQRRSAGWTLALCTAQCAYGLFVVWAALQPGFGLPFALAPVGLWLLVIGVPGRSGTDPDLDARSLLAIGVAWQVLYAYPVAGTQMAYVAALSGLCGVVCGWAGVTGLVERLGTRWPGVAAGRRAAAGALAAVALAYAAHEVSLGVRSYAALAPLNLRGARWVRLHPRLGLPLVVVTRLVEGSGCSSLVTFPGMYSFNFWSGKDSPTGFNLGAWPLLTPDEQRRVIRDIERADHVCVLTNSDLEQVWIRDDVSRDPLMEWRRTYRGRTIGGFDGYELRLTEKPDPATPPAR